MKKIALTKETLVKLNSEEIELIAGGKEYASSDMICRNASSDAVCKLRSSHAVCM